MKTTKGMTVGGLLASFVLIASLLVSLMLPTASLPVMAGVGSQENFQVELVDAYPQNDYGTNTQTWCYNVTVLAKQHALSHWDLDLCDEPAHNVKWSNPPATGDSDPRTGLVMATSLNGMYPMITSNQERVQHSALLWRAFGNKPR